MTVQATPTTPNIVTLDDVRGYLRDRPEFNILLEGTEFSDADVTRATAYTVARYNAIDRITNYPEDQINAYILLIGVMPIPPERKASFSYSPSKVKEP